MPSHLRLQSDFEPFSAETTRTYFPSSPSAPPAKKQKMSLSQTYYIAASARSKLTSEAQKNDHDLRLLVGHANLLDSLMLELADAEREQEAWFNQSVKRASKTEERHIKWVDTIVEEAMEDDDSDLSDGDSDSDVDEEEFDMIPPLRRIPSPPVQITTTELDDEDDEEDEEDDSDDEYYEDEEFDDAHALTRSPSQQQPPELVHEDDSESDDDVTPPTTPPQATMEYSEKERKAIASSTYYNQKQTPLSPPEQAAFIQDGYFIPQRNTPMIASC
ncbi:uncharacterized protein K452DRAFT_284324 [Aplosporella prunicola CBS 121167]|uniref:Uncharacterized protein n=1 Tax=Aplosporella prunicola CBS 121167 TaxID=1176127 RepID=A0A6A6BMP2_9PEZI|nr:uncharacterized protein K452DRAFT_284324 [Aplosporella prunicola CBS 121167]KAF2144938.1 hypothetical protein K452DRAFT_284324 [Aplosporella prunicola CBS 121167]